MSETDNAQLFQVKRIECAFCFAPCCFQSVLGAYSGLKNSTYSSNLLCICSFHASQRCKRQLPGCSLDVIRSTMLRPRSVFPHSAFRCSTVRQKTPECVSTGSRTAEGQLYLLDDSGQWANELHLLTAVRGCYSCSLQSTCALNRIHRINKAHLV